MALARLVLALASWLAPFPATRAAQVYTHVDQLPGRTYDFVIVGGGTAGNVLAARLTEDPAFSVLLLEAGLSNDGQTELEIPFLAPTLLANESIIWNYTTTAQAGLGGRAIAYPRGRVLGGSSSINFLAYTRGADEEFDRWAEAMRDAGWAWRALARYYRRNSRLVPPADGHDTAGEVDPRAHGHGPLGVSVAGWPDEIDARVFGTAALPDSEWPFNGDVNSGRPLGLSYLQNTVDRGARASSATAYLAPALRRPNLHVLVGHTATRLLASAASRGGKPVFRGVEFASGPNASRETVHATKEVILSAGAIGTPQLLMLSGIGDPVALRSHNITPLVDLPEVGQGLRDHPIVSSYWTVRVNSTLDNIWREQEVYDVAMGEWVENRTGVFVDTPGNSIVYARIPGNDSIWETYEDTTAGPNTPHYEMLFYDGFSANAAPLPATGHFFTINTIVVAPQSVGAVTLASPSPFDAPRIDPAFYGHPFDLAAQTHAVRAARRFAAAAPFRDFVLAPYGAVSTAGTAAALEAAIRANTITIWHPACTARMGAVVDARLRVLGTAGLRAVDASVLPEMPAGHPVAAVYIVAERAADLVKEDWA